MCTGSGHPAFKDGALGFLVHNSSIFRLSSVTSTRTDTSIGPARSSFHQCLRADTLAACVATTIFTGLPHTNLG